MYSTNVNTDNKVNSELVPDNTNIDEIKLANSYNFCLDQMAFHSKSFFFASRFLPENQRKSVAALYAFARLVDDIVDESLEKNQIIHEELDKLKIVSSKLAKGYYSYDPIFLAFGDTITKHKIPVKYVHELIEGVRMDLHSTNYRTDEQLDLYMYRVASTIGLMWTHIFLGNPPQKTLARASDLGKAMQLTNILRDIKEDYLRGRIYLPEETRKIYNVTDDDIKSTTVNNNLQELIQYETRRAKNYYELAELGIEDLPATAAYTVQIASKVYGEILEEIRRKKYQVLKQRVVVSKFRKILIAIKVRIAYLGKLKDNKEKED